MPSRRLRLQSAWLAAAPALCALSTFAAEGHNGRYKQAAAQVAPAYEDRLIDGGNLEVDSWSGDIPERNTEGWPRSLRLDGIYAQTTSNGRDWSNAGFGVSGMLATPQYGAWSIDGVFNVQAYDHAGTFYGPGGQALQGSDTASVLTIWQRDMPFDAGWRATNGLGMLNTPSLDMQRLQPRWIMPTSPMIGVLTEWRSVSGAQLTAATGEPGLYTGAYVPGFRRLGGQVTTVGGQWEVERHWTVGAQYMGANDVLSAFTPYFTPETAFIQPSSAFSTRSGLMSAAWQDARTRVQVNYLQSGNSVTASHAGAWADALIVEGRTAHGFGLFNMAEDLAWANQVVGTGARGAYYRMNFASRRWLWDAYVDYSAPLGDIRASASTYGSGSLRYQVSRDVGIGAGATGLVNESGAWSAFAYAEVQHPVVINRTQISTGQGQGRNEVAISANQTWNVPSGTRLTTTVAGGRYSADRVTSNQFGLAASGGGDIAPNLGVDLNVQWLHASGETEPTNLTGNVSFNWRFTRELALIATAYRNQIRTRGSYSPFQTSSITSPIDLQNQITQINERGLYFALRYEQRAGTMGVPLGGMPGSASGTIVGYVFLDGNEDGRFTALEAAVPNVTVVLDGRFSVRTDTNGRFEFPMVVAGRHTITAVPDNVPLAWHFMNEGRHEVEVPVRGTVNLELGAQRLR